MTFESLIASVKEEILRRQKHKKGEKKPPLTASAAFASAAESIRIPVRNLVVLKRTEIDTKTATFCGKQGKCAYKCLFGGDGAYNRGMGRARGRGRYQNFLPNGWGRGNQGGPNYLNPSTSWGLQSRPQYDSTVENINQQNGFSSGANAHEVQPPHASNRRGKRSISVVVL